MMTHKKNDLSFELDQAQKPDPIIEIHETSFPGSRHRFIELLEDNSEGVRFDGKIDCRHLQWEFKCPKRWSELTQTALDDVRFCESCHQNVYTAYSRKDLKRLQSEGACVRIITKENGAMLGAVMAPEYDTNQGELGEALILSIVEMTQVIENYFKRRGYYDEHSLMRLQSMLSRFAQQISENLRDKNTGLAIDLDAFEVSPALQKSVRRVFELIEDKLWIERRRKHNREYRAAKPIYSYEGR